MYLVVFLPYLVPFITHAAHRKAGRREAGEVMTAACVFTLCSAEGVNCFSVL